MSRPLAIANGIGMKPFVVFDGDCDKANDQQKRDNGCLLTLLGSTDAAIQDTNLFATNFVMWKSRILDEMRRQVGEAVWDQKEQEARDKYMLQSGVQRKNPVLVSATTELLIQANADVSLLDRAVSSLLEFSGLGKGVG